MNLKPRRLLALAAAGLALAAPATAGAATQSLNNVAIATGASSAYLVLDVAGGSTAIGAKVIQYYGTWGSNQRWSVVPLENGRAHIISQSTGYCLTTNGLAGSQLYVWPCTLGGRQEWQTNALTQAFQYSTHWGWIYNAQSNLNVAVDGDSDRAGTRVIGWPDNTSTNRDVSQGFQYFQLY